MFLRTAARYADDVEVLKVVGEEFVEIVEAGEEYTQRAQIAVRKVIEPLLDKGVDRVVLGCTHYPFLTETIKKVAAAYHAGSNIDSMFNIIDPAPAVARHLLEVMESEAISESAPEGFSIELLSSGNPKTLQETYRTLI